MKLVELAYFLELGMNAGASRTQLLFEKRDPETPKAISEDYRRLGEPVYRHVEEICADLDLVGPLATARRLRTALLRDDSSRGDIASLDIELHGRLSDELRVRTFFALSANETKHFTEWSKGWEEVINRLPESVRDIEEARKCFALSRYAAAVFHSLQIVETGLIELGRIFEATDHQSGWNSTTKRISAILNTKYQSRTPFQQRFKV